VGIQCRSVCDPHHVLVVPLSCVGNRGPSKGYVGLGLAGELEHIPVSVCLKDVMYGKPGFRINVGMGMDNRISSVGKYFLILVYL